MNERKYVTWNPWHGCTKYSEGCRYCYVYRQDEAYGSTVSSKQCRKTQNFNLPVKKKRDGSFKVESGSIVMTCFTSDFLLKDADEWRTECWEMIKSRSDCMFYFFTKRIERFMECVPADWGDGYGNVIVGCTCENQDRADFRLPIFAELQIKYKTIIIDPMLGPVELEKYLNGMMDTQMDKIINTILTAKHHVLFFCGAGKDRTGVVSAVLLKKLGYDDKTIIDDYMKTKENLQDYLKSYADKHPEVDINTIMPNECNIKAILKLIYFTHSTNLPVFGTMKLPNNRRV